MAPILPLDLNFPHPGRLGTCPGSMGRGSQGLPIFREGKGRETKAPGRSGYSLSSPALLSGGTGAGGMPSDLQRELHLP